MHHDIALRPLAVSDAAAMVDVLSSPSLYEHIGGEPPTLDQLTSQYTVQAAGISPDGKDEWLNWIVLEAGDEPVGYVQASRPVGNTQAEIAWVIGAAWQGRGNATRGAKLMLADLYERGVRSVIADIHPANRVSEVVAEHIGLRPTSTVVDGERRWMGDLSVAAGNGA